MKKSYNTDRLVLKVADSKDVELVVDYFIRNEEFLKEWDPLKQEQFFTSDYHRQVIKKDLKEIENGTKLRLWIMKKEDKDNPRIIGTIAFSNIIKGAFLSCILGYRLDKDEINKGYITEALNKGIDIIFNEYKMHRVEANIMPKNDRSIRVVKKLGFTEEGLSKKYLKINGKWEDHLRFVLLNDGIE
ncbi:GNAT family N-acetyltransferase [Clostridiaceae bacterium M8S5]|nr:GNAT family N-acetyltransferase [Clostridiaceae bacterium M8S5]